MSKPQLQRFAKCLGQICLKQGDFWTVLRRGVLGLTAPSARARGAQAQVCRAPGGESHGHRCCHPPPACPPASSTKCPVHVDRNPEGRQPAPLPLHRHHLTAFLQESSGAQAKSFYPGQNQAPHRRGQVCVCTAASSQCHGARWQAARPGLPRHHWPLSPRSWSSVTSPGK